MRAFLAALLLGVFYTPCGAFCDSKGGIAHRHYYHGVYHQRPPPTRTKELSNIQLCAAINEGTMTVTRGPEECQLAYRIVRPMALSSQQAAPIVVLHGGPSVPSDYCYPLQDHVPYRSIVHYDQIGCGSSSEPTDLALYSIDAALDDLEALLRKLGLRRFHLYGQSFGGILAFEYAKRVAERVEEGDVKCLSVILSSAPTSVAMVEHEANQLVAALGVDNEHDDVAERFRMAHQCRTSESPAPLKDAYAHAGTVWRGTTAIADYEAKPPGPTARRMPSCLVLRGEHDFVSEKCVQDWKECFNHKFVRYALLEGCSHHGLLENGPMYGDLVDSFFGEYD